MFRQGQTTIVPYAHDAKLHLITLFNFDVVRKVALDSDSGPDTDDDDGGGGGGDGPGDGPPNLDPLEGLEAVKEVEVAEKPKEADEKHADGEHVVVEVHKASFKVKGSMKLPVRVVAPL